MYVRVGQVFLAGDFARNVSDADEMWEDSVVEIEEQKDVWHFFQTLLCSCSADAGKRINFQCQVLRLYSVGQCSLHRVFVAS